MDLSDAVDMRIVLISIIFAPAYIGAVTTVVGYRGQSVQIRCPYESGYETHMKYLCRGACSILSLRSKDIPVQSGSAAKDERFSLNDDTAGRVFTVTITDLRSEDGGTYWCAIQRTLHDIYTEMNLLVETQQGIASQLGDPTRVSPSPAAQTTTSVRKESTHVSPSTSATTVLSVCLPLLLSGLALGSVVLYCKRRRTTCTLTDAYALRRTQKGTRTHKDGNHYESELPGMRHVYQHLQLETNESDSVYQSLQLEINEYDSVYQTLTPKPPNQKQSTKPKRQHQPSKIVLSLQ